MEDFMDQVFIDDVMYLYDIGEPFTKIAYVMGCDVSDVEQIVYKVIASNTSDYLELL
jgi:hypothetical protein